MTGEQLRAARALLKLGTRDLAALAGVDKMAVVRAEAGSRKSYVGTIEKLRVALEAAGIVFLAGVDGEYLPTAALRWGAKPIGSALEQTGDNSSEYSSGGLSNAAWDDDFEVNGEASDLPPDIIEDRAYWQAHPERWAKLSEDGKAVLSAALRL
jgi:transcriptional regulator with XRE-family HTH domain